MKRELSRVLQRLKLCSLTAATEKHILKYSTQQSVLIEETAADYAAVTKPYIESQEVERLQVSV